MNSGNLKFDIGVNEQVINKKAELAKLLLANDNQVKRTVWLVASTHEGDEVIALTAFKELLPQYPSLLLVLVPRHPERFEHVANLCLEQQLTLAKRSKNTIINDEQVWILDSLGELMAAFALSDIVTMGGSFSEIGGHNPLEPALFNKPVIVGHDMSNFNEIMQQLRQENAIIELTNSTPTNESSTQLVNEISALLQQPKRQQTLGENALKVVLQNQGASEKTLAQVINLLPITANITSTMPLGDNS
jgi:3-deoxy-D-manno-octulosonic-acid transferase